MTKSGLYICKCYHKNLDTGKIIPVLKFGMTNNIDTRMYYYNRDGIKKKLIAFFPCNNAKFREELFKDCSSFEDDLRMNYGSEHIDFQSGYFRRMYNELEYWSKVTWTKTPQGIIFNEP
jgi:hypothetical protein